jgi:hypothetical protein
MLEIMELKIDVFVFTNLAFSFRSLLNFIKDREEKKESK